MEKPQRLRSLPMNTALASARQACPAALWGAPRGVDPSLRWRPEGSFRQGRGTGLDP